VKTQIFKTTLTGLTASLLSITANAQQGPELSYDQIKADLDLAQEAYSRIHPGYTRYASQGEMDSAWDELELQAKNGMSTAEFYLGVQNVLTKIRCDHTKAELPKSLIELRKENPVYLPLLWSVVEGRGFIRVTDKNSDLNYGDEILAIDGRPLPELIDAVDDYIPVDGYTEWSKNAGISESLEFRGGGVDHFGALLWDVKPETELLIRTADDTEKTVTTNRIHFKDWSSLGNDSESARNFKDAVTFDRIGEKAAYLRIDTFVNYREYVDPDNIYNPVFDSLKSENREALILDLRNNGGGSSDASGGLLNRLIPNKKTFNKDVRVATLNLDGLREHLWTWEKKALKPNRLAFRKNNDGSYSFRKFAGQHGKIKPAKNVFTGKLIVLTSNANSSGSAAILAHLKEEGRAVFVGEKAGGSAEGPTAGIQFTLTLPESGIKTRIPAIRAFHNISSFDKGLSVSPDVYAPMTIEAFREKRDPAMEVALKMIE